MLKNFLAITSASLWLRDISKAFDKVCHQGLSYKMIVNKLPDYLIRVIHSYLQNRTARIRIGEYAGENVQLESRGTAGKVLIGHPV